MTETEALEYAINTIKHYMSQSCGACGTPNSMCDSDCEEAARDSEALVALAMLLKKLKQERPGRSRVGMTQEKFLKSAKRGRIGGSVDQMQFCPKAVLEGKRPLALGLALDEMDPSVMKAYQEHILSGKIGYYEAWGFSGPHGIFFVPGNEAKARTLEHAIRVGNSVLQGLLLGYSADDVNAYMFKTTSYDEAMRQWAEAEAILDY